LSLKNFHVVFIFLAALCCIGFFAWTIWLAAPELLTPLLRAVGWGSGIAGVFLFFYGFRFYRKAKDIII